MAKVFTRKTFDHAIDRMIDEYEGNDPSDTEIVQATLRATFDVPLVRNVIFAEIIEIFQHPGNYEKEVKAFHWGMSQTCPNEHMVDILTTMVSMLAEEFCLG